MRKIIGWPLAWTLFWMGDLICRPLRLESVDSWPEWLVDWNYRIYNRLMCWSSDVQDWAGLKGPWQQVE